MQSLPTLCPERIPPVPTPDELCAWCWYVLHPLVNFPKNVSSTICPGHATWMLQQAQARRQPAPQNDDNSTRYASTAGASHERAGTGDLVASTCGFSGKQAR